MLRRIWRRLVRFFRRLLGTPLQPSPRRGGSQNSVSVSERQTEVKTGSFSDAEYEQLLMQLLDGVDQGWHRGQVRGFLMGKKLNQADLVAWLRQFGERLRESAQPNEELAQRMVLMSQLGCGELGEVAGEIGRDLLSKFAEIAPTNPIDDAGIDEAEVWLNQGNLQGNLQAMVGDLQGAVAVALASYDQALQNKPDDYVAWYNRGLALDDLGQYEKAITSYDQAVHCKPDLHQAWNNRGLALVNLGQYEQAIASYDQAIHFKPDKHQAWYNRAVALVNLGQLEQAIASYDQAVYCKPDFHEAWYNRSVALEKLGQYEQALASYDQVVQIRPDFHEAWYNRGVVLEKLGQYEQAIASYCQALQIKPDDHQACYNRGVALWNLGQLEQAIASWDQALHFKPNLHQACYNRGVALVNLGRYEQALASFDQALHFKPDYYEAWDNRGAALMNSGQIEQAITSFEQALHFKPDFHAAWYNRGVALINLGQIEQAVTSFEQALHFKPGFHEAWTNRGVALGDLGQYEQAIASYDQALYLKPDFHAAWNNRGTVLEKLQQYEQAIASYDQALYLKPDYHEAWINRGGAARQSLKYHPQAAVKLQLQFPASTPILPNSILTRRGYEGELLCYQEGLKHCPQDTHPEGWGLLHQCMGNAYYFQGKVQTNYRDYTHQRDYWHQAETEYCQAIITLTQEAFPEQHLEVMHDLMRVLFGLGRGDEAKQWRRHGLEVFRQLLNSKTTSFQRRQLEAKLISFSQMRVDVLVEDGELVPALEAAERNKNHYLTWIFDAQKEHVLSPSYREIQQLTNSTTAIVYWHLSPHALTTFIIKHDADEPIVTSFPPFLRGVRGDLNPSPRAENLQYFETWVKNWNQHYQDYRSSKEKADPPQPPFLRGEKKSVQSWRDNLPELLKELSDILHIPAILPELTHIKQLILIPHRDLHRFPLHALFPDSFTITYLPSAQFGITSSNSPLAKGGWGSNLLSVEHPDSEGFELLPHAEIEAAAITQLFKNHTRIASHQATKTAVRDALTAGYSIFHFTGHGTYNSDRPKQSALFLSGNDSLTLEDICNLPLSNYQLVTLAACETALTGNQTIETEYVGLVSAFLYQRVTYVVSTLWTVTDLASSLLTIYFYWQLKKGKSPIVALANAQKWLRHLTYRTLERIYSIIFAKLPKEEKPLRPFLRSELYQICQMEPSQKQQKPFDHPYYWAAFTVTGGYND